jgi:chromosome partitioning protein
VSRIIAVMNQKGGVGKTTTATNLCHGLALQGQHVTAVDLDPQGHLSASFGHHDPDPGLDQLMDGSALAEEVLRRVRDNVELVPPGSRLNEVDGLKEGGAARGRLLRDALTRLPARDFVIIDCPPSSGLLGMNALLAANELLIPVTGDYLSLSGLSRLMRILKQLEQKLGRPLPTRMVMTRFNARRRHAREVQDKIQQYFPDQLVSTTIREAAALAESPSFGKSIFEYRPTSTSAREYQALTREYLSPATA